MTEEGGVIRRVKRNAIGLAILGAAAAFGLFGRRAGLSLTIGAALVIFNFFVLEKVMGGFLHPRTGMRVWDFAIPAVGFLVILLLLTLILKWKGFDYPAGLVGLSVTVAAIGWEGLRGFWRR